MGGNVWQWCEDWYDKNQDKRVFRGAAWDSIDDLQSSNRHPNSPTTRMANRGFRCVLAPASAPASVTASAVAAGQSASYGPGQIVDLLALHDLDFGSAPGPNAAIIRREAGRLRIESDQYSGTVRAPLEIVGNEYELEVGVGREFGTAVFVVIPGARGSVQVLFNSSGLVQVTNNREKSVVIPAGNAWPVEQPIILKVRVKMGTNGEDDELEAKVGNRPGVIWHGRLADYQFEGKNPDSRPGLVVSHDVKTIESFSLRMIQGEAKLLPPAN
jgi:hypothetical protein